MNHARRAHYDHRAGVVVLLAGALLLLGGCQAPPPPPPPAAPAAPPPVTVPVEPGPIPPAVNALLTRARAQIDNQLLTTPPGNNALTTLEQALASEPQHPDVVEAVFRGRERIAESYLGLAERALQRRDLDAAEQYLNLAVYVDAEHIGIPPMRERLQLARAQRTRAVPLTAAELTARSAELRTRLRSIGAEAKQLGARMLIQARSDEEGRWLYEQLNAAPGPRLRAELRLGSPGLELRFGPAATP